MPFTCKNLSSQTNDGLANPPPHPTAIFVGARLALRGIPPGKNICYGKNGFASSDIEKKSKQPKVHYHYHSSTVPSVYIIYILHFGVLAILHIRCQPTENGTRQARIRKHVFAGMNPRTQLCVLANSFHEHSYETNS